MLSNKRVTPLILCAISLIAIGLFVTLRFYNEGYSPRESATESGKTQTPEPQSSTSEESKTARADAEAPNEPARKLVQAWNQGNPKEIANLFTPDAMLTMPNGSKIQSKSEIEKVLVEKREGLLNGTTLSNEIVHVEQIDAKTAVVKGRYQLTGVKILGFSTDAVGTFSLRQLNRDGKWSISKAEVKNGAGD